MAGIMSISQAKEAERARLQQEVEEFKANGGKIKKIPKHSVGYGYQNYRQSKQKMASRHPSQPSTFSPKAEAKKCAKLAAEREDYFRRKEKARINGQAFNETPPWEQD